MDGLAWVGVGGALAATGAAFFAARRARSRGAVWALAVAALFLRVPPAAHLGISPWDERYHALVAKNALAEPFVPKLVAEPLVEPAVDDWRHSHVWLHKPPGMTWLIAFSYAVFGVNELALRAPSVVLSSLFVLLVFAIARRFASEEAALVAAALAAWHGWTILLVAGWRASDHLDVGMTFTTALGALGALRAAESLGDSRVFARRVALVGVATACAYYVKETPALIVPWVLLLALRARDASWRACGAALTGALAVAAALVLPWLVYTAREFPELAAFARARGRRYFFNVVDGQGGPWYFHLANLHVDFSPFAGLALLGLAAQSLRRRELRPLAGWALLVYAVFTLAATKMEAYPMVAAPAVFAALGWFAWDTLPWPPLRALVLLALGLWFGTQVWGIEALGRARDPLWARELRRLGAELDRLPPGKRLVYVSDSPIECSFYTGATCVVGGPTIASAMAAESAGFAVTSYGVSKVTGVMDIPLDPAALAARRLRLELHELARRDVLVFNARDASDLEAYLQRQIPHADVSSDLPQMTRRVRRKLRQGAALVVLLPPGAPKPRSVTDEFPDAVFVEDATYAYELH